MSLIPSSGEQPVPRCGSEREHGVSRALSTVQSNAAVGRGRGEAGGVRQPGPPRALTLAEELASWVTLGETHLPGPSSESMISLATRLFEESHQTVCCNALRSALGMEQARDRYWRL